MARQAIHHLRLFEKFPIMKDIFTTINLRRLFMTKSIKTGVLFLFLLPTLGSSHTSNPHPPQSNIGEHRPLHFNGNSCNRRQLRELREMVREIRLDCQNAWREARCLRKELGHLEREIDQIIYN